MKTLSVAAPVVSLCLALALSACSTANPDVISRNQTQQLQSVRYATVASVRRVVVDGSQSGVGATAGALVGGIAGASVGGYRESLAVGVLGAVAGGILGNAIERSGTKEDSVELTLRMPDGSLQAIVQAQGTEQFFPGETVQLVGSSGRMRVSHVR